MSTTAYIAMYLGLTIAFAAGFLYALGETVKAIVLARFSLALPFRKS